MQRIVFPLAGALLRDVFTVVVPNPSPELRVFRLKLHLNRLIAMTVHYVENQRSVFERRQTSRYGTSSNRLLLYFGRGSRHASPCSRGMNSATFTMGMPS